MSIRIWEEIADQKKQVEDQREEILAAFKQRKVADELGQVKAEKLFQPITKLLEKPREEAAGPPALPDFPDYAMAGEDINYMHELPFAGEEAEPYEDPHEDLKPFTEEEMIVPLPDYDIEEEFPEKAVLPESDEEVVSGEKPPTRWSSEPTLPSYSEVFPRRKKKESESVYLGTLEKFLKKKDPAAVLTMGDKKLSYSEAEKEAYEIYSSRAQKLLKGEDIGKKKLGPFTGKSRGEIREMLKEMTGKGFVSTFESRLSSLIPRLSLGISSIFAGNTSVKLREEMKVIAQLLHQAGVISSEQKKKVLSLK